MYFTTYVWYNLNNETTGKTMFKILFLAASLLTATDAVAATKCGKASWYGPGFNGRTTANGEIFDENKMTAAHKTLPFGTKVKVKHNGKSVVVTINDRGPFVKGRIIDLSKAAAGQLGLIKKGVGRVCLTY